METWARWCAHWRNSVANETLNAYGLWQVTTEGDCEGRSIKDLGINEGFLDEIAFSLAGEACYGLRFSAVYPTTAYRTRRSMSVSISRLAPGT